MFQAAVSYTVRYLLDPPTFWSRADQFDTCAPQTPDLVQKYDMGNGSRIVREYAPKNLNAVLADPTLLSTCCSLAKWPLGQRPGNAVLPMCFRRWESAGSVEDWRRCSVGTAYVPNSRGASPTASAPNGSARPSARRETSSVAHNSAQSPSVRLGSFRLQET